MKEAYYLFIKCSNVMVCVVFKPPSPPPPTLEKSINMQEKAMDIHTYIDG